MNDQADTSSPQHDAFDQAYRADRRLHLARMAIVWSATAGLAAVFAYATSLHSLRWLAVGSAVLPLPFLAVAVISLRNTPGAAKALQWGAASTIAAWVLVAVAFTSDGLHFGYQRDVTEIEWVDNNVAIENTKDAEQAAILAAIERARTEPSPATFRALVPYLDNVRTNLILEDGTARNTSSLVREVLWSDQQLLFRSLHEEALAMAALLPADAVAPEEVTVRVAERLEFALKTLITAHSEQKIQGSFDVPSVGVNITVETTNDDGEIASSNREIGITYPYQGVYPGDVVFVNAAVVNDLLKTIRKDLDY